MTTELPPYETTGRMVRTQPALPVNTPLSPFGSLETFETAQRMAKALSSSTFVPKEFRGNIGDCLILLETASRTNMPIVALMQNTYVVHGKPSFSSAFMAGMINNSRRFDGPLQFKYNDDLTACYAHATSNGQEYRGITVTMAMAQKEGWVSKKGSKWQTMPELMLQYRATSFFARAYCADLIMGMHSADELVDSGSPQYSSPEPDKTADLNARFAEKDTETVDHETGEIKEEKEPELPESLQKAMAAKKAKNAADKQQEEEKKRTRTRPSVIAKFKAEIDYIDHPDKLDTWRLKRQNRIARDLPKQGDQDQVYAYAQEHYEKLKAYMGKDVEQQSDANQVQDSQPEPNPQESDPQEVSIITCPQNGEQTHHEYCNTDCKLREGCPAHDENQVNESKLHIDL